MDRTVRDLLAGYILGTPGLKAAVGWYSVGEGDNRAFDPLGCLAELAVAGGVIPPPTDLRQGDLTVWSYGTGTDDVCVAHLLPAEMIKWARFTLPEWPYEKVLIAGHLGGICQHSDRGVDIREIAAAIRDQL